MQDYIHEPDEHECFCISALPTNPMLGRMLPAVRHWLGVKEKEFRDNKYVTFHLPVDKDTVDKAKKLILESNVRRPVMEDEEGIRSWSEVQAQDDFLYVLKQQLKIIDALASSCKSKPHRKTLTWANIYAEAECIPKHTDNEGSLQAVFVLESPDVALGGATILHEPINKTCLLYTSPSPRDS